MKTTPLAKCATGIRGLDQVTEGGLPRGRATLVCGSAGTGKSLLAMQFLTTGARQGEPGIFIAFEEREDQVLRNLASLDLGAAGLVARRKLLVRHVAVERAAAELGDYDFDPLFARIGAAIDAVGAKRIVLDTVERLFGGFSRADIVRSELERLLVWLSGKGVTSIITAEAGKDGLTRHGVEEYLADCVIVLEQSMALHVATRQLRVLKYRGSAHGSNQYPFLLSRAGITVVPVTALGLQHSTNSRRISTGIATLDRMFGGSGYYRGTTAMISGTTGTGKTSVAGHFTDAACRRGERVVYFAFEESARQIARNMASIGIDLGRWVRNRRLRFECCRPATRGLEGHMAAIQHAVDEHRPHVVVFDPISDFFIVGGRPDVKALLTNAVDMLKSRGITALFTALTHDGEPGEQSAVGISSIIDTWLVLRNVESAGERNRVLLVVKSRGMEHSNQVREFHLSRRGVQLFDVGVGPQGVLVGSQRAAQEALENQALTEERAAAERRRREFAFRQHALDDRISAMRSDFNAQRETIEQTSLGEQAVRRRATVSRKRLAAERQGGSRRGARR